VIKLTKDLSPASLHQFLHEFLGGKHQPKKEKWVQIEKKPKTFLLKLEKAK